MVQGMPGHPQQQVARLHLKLFSEIVACNVHCPLSSTQCWGFISDWKPPRLLRYAGTATRKGRDGGRRTPARNAHTPPAPTPAAGARRSAPSAGSCRRPCTHAGQDKFSTAPILPTSFLILRVGSNPHYRHPPFLPSLSPSQSNRISCAASTMVKRHRISCAASTERRYSSMPLLSRV